MKKYFPAWMLAATSTFIIACDTKPTDPEQLKRAHERNAVLRQSITDCQNLLQEWKNLLRDTGEDTPGLQEEIDKKNEELASALVEEDSVKEQIKERKLRALELQDRLGVFRDTFSNMQKEIANSRR